MRPTWGKLVALATLGSLFAAAPLLIAGPAYAQRATRGLTPVPYNENSPVKLSVTLDQKEPQIGTTVSICFDASKSGYATLWNVSTAGQVVRIFPNQFSKVGQIAMVEPGRRYCAGASGDPFRFRVDGPAGTEDLFLIWTTRPELQPNGTSYSNGDGLVQDLQQLAGASVNDWGTEKLTYDIVPAGGAVPPTLAPAQVSGVVAPVQATQGDDTVPTPRPTTAPTQTAQVHKFFIVALGANVEKLTKSNQDALMFTSQTAAIFGVPKANIRYLPNGTNAAFVSAMDWLTEEAGPDDYVFIYFSGHGGRVHSASSSDGWDEFLVPYDFETPKADPKNLISSQRFAYLINKLQTKNVIAVIDACYSAGVFRGIDGEMLGARKKFWRLPAEYKEADVADALESSMPRTRAAGGRNRLAASGLLLAAARRDQYAIEGSDGSFFTVAMVQEMNSKQGGSLMDVFDRSVTLTEKFSDNKQDPTAVGNLGLGRSLEFNQ